VEQISFHSAATFPSPRSRNLRNPRCSLICPNTGSTTAWRGYDVRLYQQALRDAFKPFEDFAPARAALPAGGAILRF